MNLSNNLPTTSKLLGREISKEDMNLENMRISNLKAQTNSLISSFNIYEAEQASLLNKYCMGENDIVNQGTSLPTDANKDSLVNENENDDKNADQNVESDTTKVYCVHLFKIYSCPYIK